MDRNMIMQVKENVNGRIQLVRYMYVHVKLCHLCILYDIFNFKNMWTKQGRATGNKRDVLFQFSFSFLCIMAERQKVKSLSRVQLFATPWTVAYQAPLSMGFSRQQHWSGFPFPSKREGRENMLSQNRSPCKEFANEGQMCARMSSRQRILFFLILQIVVKYI